MKRQRNINDEDLAHQIAARFGEQLEGWRPPKRTHEPAPRQKRSKLKRPRRRNAERSR